MSAPKIITTGHDASGQSVFIPDLEYKVLSPQIGLVYSSGGPVLDVNGNADIAAFAAREKTGVMPTEGSAVAVVEWPPSANSQDSIHRTLSVDIGVIISGQIECHLDSGESRLIKQGEVLVQRGTKHYWVNPSATEPARMIAFVLPSKPVEGAEA
ncbi:hypothetical protein LSUE1_G008879 [Lachnellula suecica]|uniref:Cupin type-2 domain-containing protein n=1 Tax=Lachnellula suecica TaxID=602035 RepID=A0A8T9BT99_9HELO|nr:hypothetical protein LSUE1_G008879 [Lachnellula suecica]